LRSSPPIDVPAKTSRACLNAIAVAMIEPSWTSVSLISPPVVQPMMEAAG